MARLDPQRRETLRGLIVATLRSGEDDLVDGLMDVCEQAFRAGFKQGEEKRRRDGQDAVIKMRARRDQLLALVRHAIAQYKAEAQRVLAGLRLALEDSARDRASDPSQGQHDDDDETLWRAADRELQNAARQCLRSLRRQVEESDEAALSDASRELIRPAFDTEDLLPELKLIRSGRYRQATASPPLKPHATPTPDLHLVDDHPPEISEGHGTDSSGGDLTD